MAPVLLISRLECVIAGQTRKVRLLPETIAARAYGREEALEHFRCNFGLNPDYRERIEKGGLRVTGVDDNGEVRVMELHSHPFLVATLFLPQLSSSAGAPHPLVVAFIEAAAAFRARQVSLSRTGAA